MSPTAPTTRVGPFLASAPFDSLIAPALVFVAMVPLGSSFAGWSWAVVGGIGAVVGVAVAIMLRAVRQGITAILGMLFVAYVVLAGPVALHGTDASVALPGPGTIEEVSLGTLKAWGLLSGTHPLVAAQGPPMLIPFLFGLVGGGLAAGLALTSRRPWAPVPIPLLVLVGSLLFSRAEAAWVLATGAAVGLGILGWLALRGWLIDPASTGPGRAAAAGWSAGRAVRGAAISLLAVLAALQLAAPVTGSHRFVLRDRAATPDVESLETPLSGFRAFTQPAGSEQSTLYGKKLLTVRGLPAGQQLRFATLDTYSGGVWRAANGTDATRRDDRYLRLPPLLDTPARGRLASVTVEVGPHWTGPWVPTVGDLRSFRLDGADRALKTESLRYDPATQSAVLPLGLQDGDSYAFRTRIAARRLSRMMKPFPQVDPELYAAAAFIDDYAVAWSARATSPMDAVFRVARKLRARGRYSDGGVGWESQFGPGHNPKRLGPGFLSAPRMAGNDEQYAATMALLANRLRVPARVVVGATVGKDGVVQGRDVSSWVEIRIADGSWRALPTARFMSNRPVRRSDKVLSPITLPPQSSQPNPPEQPPTDQPADPQKPSQDETETDSTTDAGARRLWPLLVGALLWLVPAFKILRRERRKRSGSPSHRVAAAWTEVADRATDLGLELSTGPTRPRQASALGDGSVALAERVDTTVFAYQPPADAEVAAVWSQAREVSSDLGRGRPVWRRLLAPLNPASLRRR